MSCIADNKCDRGVNKSDIAANEPYGELRNPRDPFTNMGLL